MADQTFTISRWTVSPHVVIDEADLTSPEMNAAMAKVRDAFARRNAEAVQHAMFGGRRTIEGTYTVADPAPDIARAAVEAERMRQQLCVLAYGP